MNRILRAAPVGYHLAIILLLTAGLYIISLQNYLLFHVMVELFSVTVAFSILILTWNARAYLDNGYLVLLGIASLFTVTFDLLHTLTFKGMGVFPLNDANLPTQLWLIARYLQSLSFLAAPLFIRRRMNIGWMAASFSVISAILLLSIFQWNIFPVAYVEGSGLTIFKIVSEYIIILIYCIAAWLLWKNRSAFDLGVRNLLLGSIFASIITEIFFTTYIGVTDFSNLAGHYFKIVAFYLLYKAIIQTGFVKPYNIIFRNLKQSEAALIHSRDELEDLVRDRTHALEEANRELRMEVQERAEVQSALGRQQALLQAVFQQAGDGILVSNMQGQITMLNTAVMRITQMNPNTAITFTPENLGRVLDIDGNEVRAENWPLNLALQGETTVGQEYQLTRPQGSVYNILLSAAPLSDVNGTQIGVVAVFADITRQKQAEEGLRSANLELESRVIQRTSQLERSNRELQEFAYVASHDLQEPLRKIIAFADRLNTTLTENLNEHERDYLHRMQNAASRMREMIDDLLSLSRITTKARPFTQVDLTTTAREVMDDLEIAINESKAAVQIDALPTIQADPAQMHQLLQNLLSNAIKFRHPDQLPRIHIYSRPAANGAYTQPAAEIIVEDNGIGFDEKYSERVFHPFSRLHGMNEYQGSGMGLAICQKIAQRHGGSITAHSTPGVGTQFIVTLPFTPAEPE